MIARWHHVLVALLSAVVVACAGCDGEVAGGRADGAAVFSAVCARCHGERGIPSPSMVARLGVKNLTSAEVQALSDDEIRDQILHGSENKQMPAFGAALTEAQVEALIDHVRTLDDPANAAAPPR